MRIISLVFRVYFQTFLYIIAAWSAPNSLKHTMHEQHVYMCKAILVCTGLLTDADKDMLREGRWYVKVLHYKILKPTFMWSI